MCPKKVLFVRTRFAAGSSVLFSLQSLKCHNNDHNIIYSKPVVWWFLLNKMDKTDFFLDKKVLFVRTRFAAGYSVLFSLKCH